MKKLCTVMIALALLIGLFACALGESAGCVTFSGTCNVREEPNLEGEVIGTASTRSKPGYAMQCRFDERGVAWYEVNWEGGTGWVSSKYATVRGVCQFLGEEREIDLDLDGDGSEETISIGDGGDCLIKAAESGREAVSLPYYRREWIWFADLDGDGAVEILCALDSGSDDYCTQCWHYADGALKAVPFAGDDGLEDAAMGKPCGVGEALLTLCGYAQTVGSYEAEHSFALVDGDHFESDSGVYTFRYHMKSDQEILDQYGIEVMAGIPYKGVGGTKDGTLAVGDVIILTATDNQSRLWFKTIDGKRGVIAISPMVNEWGTEDWAVEGRPINDVLEGIFYAG